MNSSLRIDPYDPFENPTQHRTYAMHYRSILPQVGIVGYKIPLIPTKQERKRIRHYYNAVGLGNFMVFAFVQFAGFLLMQLIFLCMQFSKNGANAEEYLYQSSIMTAVNGLLFLFANVGTAWIGCRMTKVPIRNLFQKSNLSVSKGMQYLMIGIFLQCITGYISSWITALLGQGGIIAYEPNIDYYGSSKSIIVEILYGCLIAPITEELFYRGFVLKNLSRVSQRTGIFLSAVIFGLAHQNIAQFVLAFTMGLFLGEIAIRHNSILPSIFVHVCVNSISTLFGLGYTWFSGNVLVQFDMIGNIVYTLFAVIGFVCWIFYFRTYRLPYNTPKQSMRGLRMILTSPWLLAAMAANFFMAIYAIALETVNV